MLLGDKEDKEDIPWVLFPYFTGLPHALESSRKTLKKRWKLDLMLIWIGKHHNELGLQDKEKNIWSRERRKVCHRESWEILLKDIYNKRFAREGSAEEEKGLKEGAGCGLYSRHMQCSLEICKIGLLTSLNWD